MQPGSGTAQTASSAAGVLAAAPLDGLPRRRPSRVRGTVSLASGNPPFLLRQCPQESVLLPRLRPRRRPDPLCRTVVSACLSAKVSRLPSTQELAAQPCGRLLAQTAAFYQLQLHRHPGSRCNIWRTRGLRDPALIAELGIGYAPGGNLRRHLAAQGYLASISCWTPA